MTEAEDRAMAWLAAQGSTPMPPHHVRPTPSTKSWSRRVSDRLSRLRARRRDARDAQA